MQNAALNLDNGYWKLSFDPGRGLLSVSRKDVPLPAITSALVSAEYRDERGKRYRADFTSGKTSVADAPLSDLHGKGKQYKFTSTGRPDGLELAYTINLYDDRPFMLLLLGVANRSRADIFLHDLNLLQAQAACHSRIEFQYMDHPLDFLKVGWHDWVYSGLKHGTERDVDSMFIMKRFTAKMLFDPAVPVGRGRGDFWGEGWGILTDQQSAILAGFISTADQFGTVHVNCKAGSAELTLAAPADGILLSPGEEFNSEWGYLQLIDLPSFDPSADYVAAVARQMKPRVPSTPPPAQWTHWYHFFQSITADLFIQSSFFGVQFFKLPSFFHGQLGHIASQIPVAAVWLRVNPNDAAGRFVPQHRSLPNARQGRQALGQGHRRHAPHPQLHRTRDIGPLFQIGRRAIGHNLSAINDDRPGAGRFHLFQNVRGKDDRFAFAHPLDQRPHLVFLVRIQPVRRFVENQHLGIVND